MKLLMFSCLQDMHLSGEDLQLEQFEEQGMQMLVFTSKTYACDVQSDSHRREELNEYLSGKHSVQEGLVLHEKQLA